MRKESKRSRRISAIILVLVMMFGEFFGMFPEMGTQTAKAAGEWGTLSPPTHENGKTTWDTVYFGNYYQSNGNKVEPIKWRVLSVKGSAAFLMADKCLDVKEYYTDETENTDWRNSTVRSWLNGDFFQTAFNTGEKAAILNTNLGDTNTTDRIYLPSIEEITTAAYGFETDDSKSSATRAVSVTPYAAGKLLYGIAECSWSLRSPGIESGYASVYSNGFINLGGCPVDYPDSLVRPVLHLNLNQDVWKEAGTVASDGTVVNSINQAALTIAAPRANAVPTTIAGCKATGLAEGGVSSVTWLPLAKKFGYGRVYTAQVVLTAATGYRFGKRFLATVNGRTGAKIERNATGSKVTVSYDFPATEKKAKGKSTVNRLKLRGTSTKESVLLRWSKISGAAGYVIYGVKCGKDNKLEKIAEVGKKKGKYKVKNLAKGCYYRLYVKAYNKSKKTICTSRKVHVATKGGEEFTNARKIKLEKEKITLKVGDTYRILMKIIKQNKKKTIKYHGSKTIAETTDTAIAKVKRKTITARGVGKCTVYILTQNGKRAKITVTVTE